MFQYLSDVQKNRLINTLTVLGILLCVFLGVEIANLLKENHYITRNPQSSIAVTGTSEVYATPDVATFSYSVIETGASVTEAQNKASTKGNALIAKLKKMGIDDKDIKTTGYNAYPKYEYTNVVCASGVYCGGGKQTIVGYEVNSTVTVKVRKVDTAGDALAVVGQGGVSNISGVDFVVDDMDAVQAEARDKAIADAQAKAKVLAKSLGVSLGDLLSFSDSAGGSPMYYEKAMPMDSASSGSAPAPVLAPGQNKVVGNVSLVYEIK